MQKGTGMKLCKVLVLVFWVSGAGNLVAQVHHTNYQTFLLDTVKTFSIAFQDSLQLEEWAGSDLMVQTAVTMRGCRDQVLLALAKQGRYDFKVSANPDSSLVLAVKEEARGIIQAGFSDCEEVITIKVYIPDSFTAVGHQSWRRKED